MKTFTHETVYDIYSVLKKELQGLPCKEILYFDIVNPDKHEVFPLEAPFKGYKALTNLAELLLCKMTTPCVLNSKMVRIGFQKLNPLSSFHKSQENSREKYGANSLFSLIRKNEEPSFIVPYIHALKRVNLTHKMRVLNLGVNNADEFVSMVWHFGSMKNIEFVGVDYSLSAIEQAKQRFYENENFTFYAQDINEIEALNLGRFDLIISIGTLQSSNLDFKVTFMNIVQNYLEKTGSLILGFPNCRWVDEEMIYGAKMPNFSFSEMTLLYKDVYFCKKYLQQKKFQVTLTGKEYLFLTANSLRSEEK